MHSSSQFHNTGSLIFLSAYCYAQYCGYRFQMQYRWAFQIVNFLSTKVYNRCFVILYALTEKSFPRIHSCNNNILFL